MKSNAISNTKAINAFKELGVKKTFIVGEGGVPIEEFLQMDLRKILS